VKAKRLVQEQERPLLEGHSGVGVRQCISVYQPVWDINKVK
jgi:hypothetical protein